MSCWFSQSKRQKAKGKSSNWGNFSYLFFPIYLLPFALVAGLTACSSVETTQEPSFRDATLKELTGLLHERERAIQSLKGLFLAEVKGSGLPIAQTVYGTIFFRRPGMIRLQGFSRFGGKVFDFSLNPERFVLRLPQEHKLVSGTPDEWKNRPGLSHTLRLSMLAMSGVLGQTGVSPQDQLMLVEEKEFYRLEVYASSWKVGEGQGPLRKIRFGRRSLLVVQEERFLDGGELRDTMFLDDYREVSLTPLENKASNGEAISATPVLLPFKVTAEDAQGEGWIEIVFSELVPNVPISDQELLLVHSGQTRNAK